MNVRQEISLTGAARAAGITLIVMAGLAVFANFFVMEGLVVSGDATATAANIADNELLFRLGAAAWPVVAVLDVIAALALYLVLKPVSASLSLLAGWLRLAYTAAWVAVMGDLLAAVRLVGGEEYLMAMPAEQLQSQAMLSIETFQNGWLMALMLFGAHLGVLGYLAYRSGYVPRVLGGLLILASVAYIVDTVLKIATPELAVAAAAILMAPQFIGEMAFAVWLLVRAGRLPEGSAALPSS